MGCVSGKSDSANKNIGNKGTEQKAGGQESTSDEVFLPMKDYSFERDYEKIKFLGEGKLYTFNKRCIRLGLAYET